MMKNMFGKIAPGMCRLSPSGIAISTKDGYKTYNPDTGVLVNCADFVFDVGDDMFFVMPCNAIKKGDLILASGAPCCVIKAEDNLVTAFNYTTSTVITIVPEQYMFFGNTYFFSKIVSMFGDVNKGVSMEQMMPYMMMSEMCKGGSSDFAKMMPYMMMMNGGMNNMFAGFGSAFANTGKENA